MFFVFVNYLEFLILKGNLGLGLYLFENGKNNSYYNFCVDIGREVEKLFSENGLLSLVI